MFKSRGQYGTMSVFETTVRSSGLSVVVLQMINT